MFIVPTQVGIFMNRLIEKDLIDSFGKIATVTEKLDGSYLILGSDDIGVYVKRSQNSEKTRFTNVESEYPHLNYQKHAYYAFEKYLNLYPHYRNNEFQVEVLMGNQPNVIEYKNGDKIVFIDNQIEECNIKNEIILRTTYDGINTFYKKDERNWCFTNLISKEIKITTKNIDEFYNLCLKSNIVVHSDVWTEGIVIKIDNKFRKIVNPKLFLTAKNFLWSYYDTLMATPVVLDRTHSIKSEMLMKIFSFYGVAMCCTTQRKKYYDKAILNEKEKVPNLFIEYINEAEQRLIQCLNMRMSENDKILKLDNNIIIKKDSFYERDLMSSVLLFDFIEQLKKIFYTADNQKDFFIKLKDMINGR